MSTPASQVSQPQNSQTPQNPLAPAAGPGNGTLVDEIKRGLRDAASPLDFIRNNLKPTPNIPSPQDVPVAVQQSFSSAASDNAAVQSLIENVEDTRNEKGAKTESGEVNEQTPPEPQGGENPQEPVVDAQPEGDKQPTKGPEESLKALRKKANEYKSKFEEHEKSLSQLKEELDKYKRGEAIPEVVKEKEDRISKLEYYEKLHAFRLSPEYQQKYEEPFEQLKGKALKLAEDYQVDPSVLDEALAIENKRDLNVFLSTYFDNVAALEVRGVLGQIKQLDADMRSAEAEPARSFEQIKEEMRAAREREESEKLARLNQLSQRTWVQALDEARASEKFPELVLSGNPEEDKYSREIVDSAAKEYGKTMTLLAAYGLRDIPEPVAKMLAKRFALSQAASVIAESRAHHYERAQEILKTSQAHSAVMSPPVGGGVASAAPPPARPQSPTEAADFLLAQVGIRGKK